MLILSGEARLFGWSRSMLYLGFNVLPRSVIRRQTGFAARITRTLSSSGCNMENPYKSPEAPPAILGDQCPNCNHVRDARRTFRNLRYTCEQCSQKLVIGFSSKSLVPVLIIFLLACMSCFVLFFETRNLGYIFAMTGISWAFALLVLCARRYIGTARTVGDNTWQQNIPGRWSKALERWITK